MTERIRRGARGITIVAFVACAAAAVFAKPAFMARYNADSYSRVELHDKCTVCHLDERGGARNEFGEAFADEGFLITPELRARFPDRFRTSPGR